MKPPKPENEMIIDELNDLRKRVANLENAVYSKEHREESTCVVRDCPNPPVKQVTLFGQFVWVCDGKRRKSGIIFEIPKQPDNLISVKDKDGNLWLRNLGTNYWHLNGNGNGVVWGLLLDAYGPVSVVNWLK